MRLFVLLFILPTFIYAQSKGDYKKLIAETNAFIDAYAKLSPHGDYYLPLAQFKLKKKERKALIKAANYDDILTDNNDSVAAYYMINYYQEHITQRLNQIVNHSQFNPKTIRTQLDSDEIAIVVSSDFKLVDFSLDEKTGGTYRSRISLMYYTDLLQQDSVYEVGFNDFFNKDGYDEIYTLETEHGVKYVLTGSVRGCSYCFETFVSLISFENNHFNLDFNYAVNSRDWNDGVYYDHANKTINVNYYLDDLTPYCSCNEDEDSNVYDLQIAEEEDLSINCRCSFVFDGINFVLIDKACEKVDNAQE